ncbi:hypothetical protein KEM56_002658 [Ascosphaera pollenicola]|nr:hypothetical protein KEM56_002658 [Ascosphaera pollenicola]
MAGRIRRSGVKKREALLYLRTNEKDVGVVKMGELPPAVLDMMSRIAPREQVADFLVHDVCDIKQYALLCEQVNNHNTLMAAGYIKPFDDSLRQLKEFTAFLRKRKHAALVYHPDGEVSILYPGKVQEWAFLDKSNHPSMFDVDLRFAVSTALPRLKDLPPRGTAIEPIELGGGDDDLFVADGIGGDGDGDGDVEMRDATPEPPPEEEAPPLPPPPAFFGLPFLESLDQKAIITLLYDKFHITLEELTSVNGDHKPARKFYLGFPENAREFEFLKCALEKCGMEIFSNHSGKDWLTFRRTTEHEPGTVLLHESFADFSALPGFARTLHNHINVFYVSLSQPLASTTATHFDLIFPHGGAILLTDEVITATPKRALAIVKWFIEHAKSRKRGTWKLVFRPNVSHWILELFATTRDDAFAELYRLIEEYTPLHSRLHLSSYTREDSPPASLDGYWSDWDDGEGVLSPFVSTRYIPQYGMRRDNEVDMSLRGQGAEMRNADQLIEWFAGWALMNAERYRRFVAVVGGEKKRVLERWKKWTHIEIADYKQLKGMYPRIGQYDLTNIRMG